MRLGKSSIPFNQSGIGVWAIIMIAKTAPANAATPITTTIFLLMSLLTILQISIAQTTQTAAAASAMTSVSHNHENSCNILIHSPYLSLANWNLSTFSFPDSKYFSVCFWHRLLIKLFEKHTLFFRSTEIFIKILR